MTLKIACPRLAVWLTSHPMRTEGDMIAVAVKTATVTFVMPWVIDPDARRSA